MAKDRDSKPRAGVDQTLQVRIRAKNPQIGRRKTPVVPEGEDETIHAHQEEVLGARPKAAPMDEEDATEISKRPPIPREDLVVRKPPPAAAPDERETERPSRPSPRAKNPEARPRRGMEIMGTEGAGAIAAKAKLDRMTGSLPRTRIPVLKPYCALLAEGEISVLERTLNGEFDQRDLRSAASSPKRSLERLINGAEFNHLPLEHRAGLLRSATSDPRDIEGIRAALKLAECRVLEVLRPVDRELLFTTLRLLKPRSMVLLAEVAERPLRRTSALGDRDHEDTALLAHLHALATARALAAPVEAAGYRREETIQAILATVAHPEQLPLEEGSHGVLGTFEFALADSAPAECARLWRMLVVDPLAADLPREGVLDLGGSLLARPLNKSESPLRQGLELLVNLAHPRNTGLRSAFVMPGGHGIDADVTARSLSFLYGVGYSVAAGATGAVRALERLVDDPQRTPPVFVSLLYDGGERLFVFHDLKAGRVYFRAPHGASSKPRGARRPNPDRVVEDPALGVESISTEEFNAQVGVALVPRT